MATLIEYRNPALPKPSDSEFPLLSVEPPTEDDTIPLVYDISGPLDHIFGYTDAQLGCEIAALSEHLETIKTSIEGVNRERDLTAPSIWAMHKGDIKASLEVLAKNWRAVQIVIHSREEAGWYGRIRQQARLEAVGKEAKLAKETAEMKKAILEAKRLRRNENAKRRRKGLKTVEWDMLETRIIAATARPFSQNGGNIGGAAITAQQSSDSRPPVSGEF